ncbi:glycoside hydrolase [Nonlabens ponticola]|uniref:Glycoside hydrolase n=2 Tax=Nonlabens ponticola TaxID=2496866 RepID=A0A3S9N0R4_9FLAO|nr:glycoside hydrolase [Nonlabens ponticola]
MATLTISCTAQTPESIDGISFVATRNPIDQTDVQPLLDYNADYAAVIPYGFMRDLSSPEVIYNTDRQWWGETKEGVEKTIELFHTDGLKVMLKPQIWIWRGEYTGNIQLENAQQWKQLEDSYSQYILDYAQVAQDQNVEMLCIATELDSFVDQRRDYWMELIKKIKAIYQGKITYAGNWDSYKNVHFWDQMDYIGVDAYFPLSDQKTPDSTTIANNWKKWKLELSTLSRKHDKQILFAEYGYISADYAGKEPWKNADETREVNNDAQQILLQGMYDNVWNEDWFAGGFLWKHHAEESRRGFAKRFTPQGKPAAQTVAEAYKKYE